MTTLLAQKLDRLRNCATRYELIVTDGTTSYLVQYNGRRSRAGIVDSIRKVAPALVKAIGMDDSAQMRYGAGGTIIIGHWSVKFSGRTQREAIISGELPFVGRVAEDRTEEQHASALDAERFDGLS